MQITKIKIKNFRNLGDVEILPEKEINVICGENAQGKTNLIEAIWLFTGAKSFRGAKEKQLVNLNADNAKIGIEYFGEGTLKEAEIVIDTSRTAYFNQKKLPSPIKLAGKFQAIVFSPTDLKLVKDGPKERRRFLDIFIGKLNPAYIDLLSKYNRAIAQRNFLLKDAKYHSDIFDMLRVFDAQIVPIANKITEYRKEYIQKLNETAEEIYFGISGKKENLTIDYEFSYQGDYDKALKNALKTDMSAGSTSIGPHRDDLVFYIDKKNARLYSSQGQQRSIAIALKLSEAAVMKQITGEYPVALLDDVFSELDPTRQDYILNHIKNWQVFITCCDPSNVNRLNQGKIFKVKNGVIK